MAEEKLTLQNFRNELDESVLERGWIYFNNGWVNKFREVMPGYFEAIVEEVNPHAVSWSMNEEGIFAAVFCTCGDKKHNICRHMASVLFVYEKQDAEKNSPGSWERIEEDSLQKFNNRKVSPRNIKR